ncbi:2-oxoglutarate dehydrogenase E1 component [Alicyclobacillus curvatus]|nr:2-oxoglutarate dehydrogenase E1 component [Alicyclobacillus curvatus]
MTSGGSSNSVSWNDFLGPNYAYVLELYDKYRADPNSVDEAMQQYFNRAARNQQEQQARATTGTSGPEPRAGDVRSEDVRVVIAAVQLTRNIREFGHLSARINPLAKDVPENEILRTETYGISDSDLLRIPADWIWQGAPGALHTAKDVIAYLRRMYTGTLAYDFGHVNNAEELEWLTHYAESETHHRTLSREEKKSLWYRLLEVEQFEKYLHRTFVGQKRFSIEGLDVLVPMLDWLIEQSVSLGTRYISMGMAHRGRLNVLAHVLRKPYEAIFAEFHASPNKDLVPSEGSMGINYGWTGDVKYHLGAHRTVDEGELVEARIMLANNPSHLEFVDPVVVGAARAAQDIRTQPGVVQTDIRQALAVLVHGDAAFPGEGVVAETLNMSRLPGYQVGGVIHIIANNQLGFTAEAEESRSTRYASDLAKGFEIPVVHVSADSPESCIAVVLMAHAYRERFHKDFLVDLLGYRRFGHNEMDDPAPTQPLLYANINAHRDVREIYQDDLTQHDLLSEAEIASAEARVQERLQNAYERVQKGNVKQSPPVLNPINRTDEFATAVDIEQLRVMNQQLLQWPEKFTVYPKLRRILERRADMLADQGKVDWAAAEVLAFASILGEGTAIRLTGQDTERGTFGHRHLVLHDHESGERYIPLAHITTNQASIDVHNSPLSETGPLGFEYGYDVQAEDALVLWEAQFGDFANVGQVIIDQFMASGRAKWGQPSGLVLLLPHGYEGQGPEHSSGRLERFLQLSAENNWVVANVTSAAQYFHLLRTQAQRLRREPCPLIIMTPKSLLRHPGAASPWQQLAKGNFQPVIVDASTGNDDSISRLIICSGKVAVDLSGEQGQIESSAHTAICRLEQLYPFPADHMSKVITRFPRVTELVWVQEEPRNMGAWTYAVPYLKNMVVDGISVRYVGRKPHASPAEGMADMHQAVQGQIVQTALFGTLQDTITEF